MRLAPNIHGAPVYWETSDPTRSYFYAWAEKDYLKAFSLDRHTPAVGPTAAVSGTVRGHDDAMPGGILSLSANGTTAHTGIVWAVIQDPTDTCTLADTAPDLEPGGKCNGISQCDALCYTVPGFLYAFDAENLGTPLFYDKIPRYSKMTPPTIANGKVFVATSDSQVIVYGLR